MSGIPGTGPIPTRGVVDIWGLTPATGPHPIASELRLNVNAPGVYSPSSQTFPASATSTFPLSKFLGMSLAYSTTLSSTTPGQSWVSPITGTITILIVAGGGAGGMGANLPFPSGAYASMGGGGGGGGLILTTASVTKGTSYPYSIGTGGVSQATGIPFATITPGPPGTPTIFNGNPVYTAIAGGGGASGVWPNGVGMPGGSGGGGCAGPGSPATITAGTSDNAGGNGTPGQGYSGGRVNLYSGPAGFGAGGGGGGAGGASGNPTAPAPSGYNPQAGGVGYTWPVTGQMYSSGGGGSAAPASPGGGAGGASGFPNPGAQAPSATYYGGGGGGGSTVGAFPLTQVRAGNGYQGVIIISVP